MSKDYQNYKDFDMSGATRGIPPHIARLQTQNHHETAWLDSDLSIWINHQDNETKRHINALIRHAMALKTATA